MVHSERNAQQRRNCSSVLKMHPQWELVCHESAGDAGSTRELRTYHVTHERHNLIGKTI